MALLVRGQSYIYHIIPCTSPTQQRLQIGRKMWVVNKWNVDYIRKLQISDKLFDQMKEFYFVENPLSRKVDYKGKKKKMGGEVESKWVDSVSVQVLLKSLIILHFLSVKGRIYNDRRNIGKELALL